MTINPSNFAVWLIVVNVATYAAFGIDKSRAVRGDRRISEANLIALAVLGGMPAALTARQIFRHKTRKQPFSAILWVIATIQAGAALGLVWSYLERRV